MKRTKQSNKIYAYALSYKTKSKMFIKPILEYPTVQVKDTLANACPR